MKILMIAIMVTLASCATPYQSNGFRGGYVDEKLPNNEYIISFHGNSLVSLGTVYKYWMRRASEVTVENGFSHFKVVSNQAGSESSYIINNGVVSPVNKPVRHGIIKLYSSENSPEGSIDARKYLKELN